MGVTFLKVRMKCKLMFYHLKPGALLQAKPVNLLLLNVHTNLIL